RKFSFNFLSVVRTIIYVGINLNILCNIVPKIFGYCMQAVVLHILHPKLRKTEIPGTTAWELKQMLQYQTAALAVRQIFNGATIFLLKFKTSL
ncbi:hypothetical protein L9F63_017933, partial [Diploptera punctata]